MDPRALGLSLAAEVDRPLRCLKFLFRSSHCASHAPACKPRLRRSFLAVVASGACGGGLDLLRFSAKAQKHPATHAPLLVCASFGTQAPVQPRVLRCSFAHEVGVVRLAEQSVCATGKLAVLVADSVPHRCDNGASAACPVLCCLHPPPSSITGAKEPLKASPRPTMQRRTSR